MTRGIIGTEFQPFSQDQLLRSNDQEVRQALSAVYSRGAFAVTTSIYTSTQSMDHRVSVALCDTSGGAFVLTIPYANYWGDDKSPILTFVHVAGAGNVTITASGSDTINGAATYALVPGDRIDLISDGASAWYVFSSAASSGLFVAKAGDTMTGQLVFKDGDSGSYAWKFTSTTTGMYYDSGMVFAVGNTPRWKINTSGHLIAVTDNSYDIGQSGATRPRNIYCSGLGIIDGLLTVGSLTSTSTVTFNGLTASLPVIANASKQIVSATQTGTGTQFVMSASPTITGTLTVGTIITFPSNVNLVQNSTNLWVVNASGSGPGAIFAGDAVDYDRAVKLDYTPGTTGATAGVIIIGQTNKNHANYTHGITRLYTNGTLGLELTSAGVVKTRSSVLAGDTSGTALGTIHANGDIVQETGRVISAQAYGAVGDYSPAAGTGTDDKAAIQLALDAAYTAGGGTVVLENKRYKLSSALTIPVGVTLRGPHSGVQSGWRGNVGYPASIADPSSNGGTEARDMVGSLWVCFDTNYGTGATYDYANVVDLPQYNSRTNKTAGVLNRGTIVGVNVFNSVYYNPVTGANATNITDNSRAKSLISDGWFNGVAIKLDAENATVKNCFIGGFYAAIAAYAEHRGRIKDVLIDCINGIEMELITDTAFIENVHAFPFATYGNDEGSLVRRGSFIYCHHQCDWVKIHKCFTYGHKIGVKLVNVNGATISDCGFDNTSLETSAYYGMWLSGTVPDCHITNVKCANREYGLYVDTGTDYETTVSGLEATECNTSVYVNAGNCSLFGGMYDGPGSGTQNGINNNGSGKVVAVNPTFYPTLTNNTVGSVTIYGHGQITFPATQIASSGANVLDDYEEGTFTTTIQFGGGNTGLTYTTQQGRYTKVGNLVEFHARVTINSNGTSTGTAIMWLGTAPVAGGTYNAIVTVLGTGLAAGATTSLIGSISPSTSAVNLYRYSAGSVTVLTETELVDGCSIYVSGSYVV